MPKYFACPWFKYYDKKIIHCDGADISFRNQSGINAFTFEFCCDVNGWEYCPLAVDSERRYENGEKEKLGKNSEGK